MNTSISQTKLAVCDKCHKFMSSHVKVFNLSAVCGIGKRAEYRPINAVLGNVHFKDQIVRN